MTSLRATRAAVPRGPVSAPATNPFPPLSGAPRRAGRMRDMCEVTPMYIVHVARLGKLVDTAQQVTAGRHIFLIRPEQYNQAHRRGHRVNVTRETLIYKGWSFLDRLRHDGAARTDVSRFTGFQIRVLDPDGASWCYSELSPSANGVRRDN